MSARSYRGARGAFTITELLVSAAALLVLVLPLTPLGPIHEAEEKATCVAQLGGIGKAVQACFTDNNGYGPTWDDGDALFEEPGTRCMLTWLDLLYDLGYVPAPQTLLCPADARPDEVPGLRGESWDFRFVDEFGVGQTLRYGVRGSYALNAMMSHNFKQDKFFEDPSRQVYAADGWWTWFGSLNAAWLFYEQVTGKPPPDPLTWPNWEATMVGWRHGPQQRASMVYLDGHAVSLRPLVPTTPAGLLTRTVNTLLSFTWLPGESNTRFDFDAYVGVVAEYKGREPYFTSPDPGTAKMLVGATVPIDFPDFLSCNWRTVNRVWVHLPADPDDRY